MHVDAHNKSIPEKPKGLQQIRDNVPKALSEENPYLLDTALMPSLSGLLQDYLGLWGVWAYWQYQRELTNNFCFCSLAFKAPSDG